MARFDGKGLMTRRGMGNCMNVVDEKKQQYFGVRKFGCKNGGARGLNREFGNRNRNFQKQENKEI
jgi:hypothetical protein